MGIATAYKRWRHGRGFGVHSPLAYDLVMNTLRERGAYYAYERLDAAARRGGDVSPRRLRLIFRLLVRFNPQKVAIIGEDKNGLLRLAVKSANSRCCLVESGDEANFVIINGLSSDARAVRTYRSNKLSDDSCKVWIIISSPVDELWGNVSHGLRLDNHRGMSIIVVRPGLPRQQIDVRY